MAEAMKDSGQEWIGAIPESWDTNRIRYCLNEINVKNSPVKTEQILSLVKDKGVMLYEEKGDVGNKQKDICYPAIQFYLRVVVELLEKHFITGRHMGKLPLPGILFLQFQTKKRC